MNAEGCGAHAERSEQCSGGGGGGKSLMLIVGSDVLGKEEAIGKVLMKGFFETMKVRPVRHNAGRPLRFSSAPVRREIP
jgi:hypothetical protein